MIRFSTSILLFFAASALWAQQFTVYTVAGGAAPVSASSALQTSIGDPPRVAVDSAGNIYFGSLHAVFKVDRLGALARVAGTGKAGNTGDGGSALAAQLNNPSGIAVDSAGNIYVADRAANVVRKIAGGNISTVAGNGFSGYSGDGGQAIAAQLNAPTGLALDRAGNLYVGDTGNNVVRKVSADGVITTFAGNGNQGYTGDNTAATTTALNQPQGLAWDSGGNLDIADTINNRIRRVSPDGIITTVAGNGLANYSGDNVGGTGIVSSTGDNGPATNASIVLPTDVAADQSGNLFVTDFGNSKIRQVSSGGIITTLIGNQDGVPLEEGQAAASIRLAGPTGVAVDSAANVYLTEGSVGAGSGLVQGDFRVWKISGGVFARVAGTGLQSYSGDGGAASIAQLNTPTNVAIDSAGALYIADALNHRIRKMTPGGSIVTVAGTGVAGFSGDGKLAVNAQLNSPHGVAVDSSGTIYIADTNNNRVRVVTPEGVIYTLAGNGNAGFFGDGGMAILGALHAPQAIAVDRNGNFYIADTLDHRVRKVTQDNTITTIAGNGIAGFSGDGGTGANAALNLPVSLALDDNGNIFIADQGNGRIRRVTSTGTISTVAGNGNTPESQLYNPSGVVVDAQGNVDIADSGHNLIRQAFSGGLITIAGSGGCCYSGDGGLATAAQFNSPGGMAMDPSGILYVADTGNNAIRQLVAGAAVNPSIISIVSSASNLSGPIAPGEVVTIAGVALGPPQLVPGNVTADGLVATVLSGTTVSFNGIPAPIIYTSGTQVSAVVPFALDVTRPNAVVMVQYRGQQPAQFTVPVAAVAPALFTLDYSGTGQALAFNQDGSANGNCAPNLPGTPVHPACYPAPPNTLINLFFTGAGQTSPAGVDGQILTGSLPSPVLPVSVKIGGVQAVVLFTSGVAGEVSGIMQVQAQIPPGITPGPAVPVVVQVGNSFTQQATISISQ
jgi:trimeric autotransporter adhesin